MPKQNKLQGAKKAPRKHAGRQSCKTTPKRPPCRPPHKRPAGNRFKKSGLQRLREIAENQMLVNEAYSRLIEGPYKGDVLPFLNVVHLGETLHIPAPSETEARKLTLRYIAPEAVTLLLSSSANIWWAWNLLIGGIELSDGKQVKLKDIQVTIAQTVESFLSDLKVRYLLPLEFEELSRVDLALAYEEKIWLRTLRPTFCKQEGAPDRVRGYYNVLKNPIFAIYEELPADCKKDPRNQRAIRLDRLRHIAQRQLQDNQHGRNQLSPEPRLLPYTLPSDSEEQRTARTAEVDALLQEFLSPEAIKLLLAASGNTWWAWYLTHLSTYIANEALVTEQKMQATIAEAAARFRRDHTLGDLCLKEYKDLTADELDILLSHSVWMRSQTPAQTTGPGRTPSVSYHLIKNPLFAVHRNLPDDTKICKDM